MGKNVMKMLKPSPKRGKNAFDLSHRHVLGANFGELLPITCLETVPGDYFEINCADLLRAMPMVTSPFLRAKQHIDFWFVPYTDIWHNFNQFISEKQEPMSSALKSTTYVPRMNMYDFFAAAADAEAKSIKDIHGFDWAKGASKLFDLLGYGAYPDGVSTYPSVNLWRIAAYNLIWYNEYRQQYYDDGTRLLPDDAYKSPAASLFNFDDLTCDALSTADLGLFDVNATKRIQAMFQMRYRTWKKDLFTGLMPSTQFGDVSTVDIHHLRALNSFGLREQHLKEHGDYQALFSNFSEEGETGPSNVYIRNDAYGTDIASKSEAIFDMVPYSGSSDTDSYYKVLAMAKDLANPNFDVLSLRRSQAIQIWRENALRAGNHISDNFNAHFGVKPEYQRDHRPMYLGSYDAVLNISDVNATAETGQTTNGALGDVAGKGLSSLDSKKIKFRTNDFGVIMGIFSLLPESEYNSLGIDRANQLIDRFDYFAPEMENLGLEAVSSENFVGSDISDAFVLGYAPRYYVYKTRVDKCFGAFRHGGDLAHWCSPRTDVVHSILDDKVLPLSTLYVNPDVFSVNFVADAETIGEQFLCDFFFDVEAVRPMTVLGLPSM